MCARQQVSWCVGETTLYFRPTRGRFINDSSTGGGTYTCVAEVSYRRRRKDCETQWCLEPGLDSDNLALHLEVGGRGWYAVGWRCLPAGRVRHHQRSFSVPVDCRTRLRSAQKAISLFFLNKVVCVCVCVCVRHDTASDPFPVIGPHLCNSLTARTFEGTQLVIRRFKAMSWIIILTERKHWAQWAGVTFHVIIIFYTLGI